MRNKSQAQRFQKKGKSIEPRLARAVRKALLRVRSQISTTKIVAEMNRGGRVNIDRIVNDRDLESVLGPVVAILKDTFVAGGKIGVTELNEMLK